MDITRFILEEDDGLIVIDKPDDVPTAGQQLDEPGSIQFELMRHYRRMIWAVHQLDKDTSGLNLFVRRKNLVKYWTEQLKLGAKTYLAVLDGRMKRGHLEVQEPVGFTGKTRVRGVIKSGKAAFSEFHVIDRCPTATLVKVTLHTGRTHQIRIHAEHIGHALVGDQWYGDPKDERIHRHALHAWRITTPPKDLEAEIPEDFRALCQSLDLKLPTE